MHRLLRLRQRRERTLAASLALFAGIAGLGGCEPADPLEAARLRQASGDYAGTVEPLRELIAQQPENPEANYLYGSALVRTGRASLATWSLRQAMEDPEWLLPAGQLIARASLATGDFNEVVEVTTRMLEADPDDTLARLFRAQANAHWKKDPEAALADAERVLEAEPDVLEAYEPKILALLALDRHAEAREALAESGRRLKNTDAASSSLAWHCSTTAIFASEAEEPDTAVERWVECVEKYPANASVVINSIQFHDARGELDRSLEIMRAAVAAAPGQRSYRTGLADRLRAMGETAEAEALLREATEQSDPALAAAAWVDLALFRHAMLEHAAAADALARAIDRVREVEEPSPQLLFQYADALLVSGQLDEAEQVAEDISVPAQRSLIRGRVAQERGNPELALVEFDEGLRLWPDNPWARYYAALAAEKTGDFDRALEEYRYSIRISIGATDARTRVARLLIAQNQPSFAYQLLFLENDKSPLEPEGQLLGMYLMARVANPQQLQNALSNLAARDPASVPSALARGAEGAAEISGPGAALNLLNAPIVDYREPRSAPALHAFVRFAHAAGEEATADKLVDAALAASPDAAPFHEARGLHLELAGAAPEEVRQAYARAVELDASSPVALAGLGRLTQDQDPGAALALFDRAAAEDPTQPGPRLAAARVALASGDPEAARRRLEALLDLHPFEAEAAAEVVAIDLAGDTVTARTLERATRAARFGPNVEHYDQLARVHTQLGNGEQAAKAEQRAEALRARQRDAERDAENPPGDIEATDPSAEDSDPASE